MTTSRITAHVLQNIQVPLVVIFGQAGPRKSSLYCDSLLFCLSSVRWNKRSSGLFPLSKMTSTNNKELFKKEKRKKNHNRIFPLDSHLRAAPSGTCRDKGNTSDRLKELICISIKTLDHHIAAAHPSYQFVLSTVCAAPNESAN